MRRALRLSPLALAVAFGVACGTGADPSGESTGQSDEELTTQPWWRPIPLPRPLPTVLTQHGDNARTGQQLREYALTPTSVAKGFGRLFSRTVQGSVYAQPLYVPRLQVAGKGAHDVVFVATMHNTVYAFDANDAAQSTPLWQRQLEPSVPLPDPIIGRACGTYRDIAGEIGIVGTPVIDPARRTMYLVTATAEGGYAHHLHAIDISTGQDVAGSPVLVRPSVPGNGAGSSNGTITFQSQYQNQRAGLLLSHGKVYVAFAAYCDTGPYHGWLTAFDAATLALTNVYNDTPNGEEGGIWQAGQGPSADPQGNLYVLTGNGSTTLQGGGSDGATAMLKLSADLQLVDWFVPSNYGTLNDADNDLGSAGVLLLPNTNYVVGGGKESKIYVTDRDALGHFAANDAQLHQSFYVNPWDPNVTHHIHGGPAYWSGPQGATIYVWTENDHLKSYHWNGSTFDPTPTVSPSSSSAGMPGGMLSISANGSRDGVLWTSHPYTGNANQAVVEGELRAYDASDVTKLLWSSKWNPQRDDVGNFPKFCAPTIAGGKVYLPSLAYGTGMEDQITWSDTSFDAPAIANMNDAALAIAWSGNDAAHSINVITTRDAATYASKTVLPQTSAHAPALAYGNGRLFLAWTGQDAAHHVNVATSADGVSFDRPTILGETSAHAPALAYGDGRLYVAWTGTDSSGHLNVASSTDGVTFDHKVVLDESSPAAPSLAFVDGKLYLLWSGGDANRSLNVLSSTNGGVSFGDKVVLGDSSDTAPALVQAGGAAPLFMWTGRDAAHSLNSFDTDAAVRAFTGKATYPQQAIGSPALVAFRGASWLAWTGTNTELNLARLNPSDVHGVARLNVYGLIR